MKMEKMILLLLSILYLGLSCNKDVTTEDVNQNPTSTTTNLIGKYPIVGTNQTIYYDSISQISKPAVTSIYYRQDASINKNAPQYKNNGDGTVSDLVTGLMWQQTPDRNGDGKINVSDKLTYSEALSNASKCNTGGFKDWRVPTIKELYSLIEFSGKDVSGMDNSNISGLTPFIDKKYFAFGYGDVSAGERLIDAQYVTSTKYVSTTMNGDQTVFGVNFADGRIKGYGLTLPDGSIKKFYVTYVRGTADYGKNNLYNNGNGTITDNATGLMWAQNDNGKGVNWPQALAYAKSSSLGGYSDWRLPTVKELESIVDYSRSPSTTNSASINAVFNSTKITNEAGNADWGCYWSSTTHVNDAKGAVNAAYVSFGRCMGYMNSWLDVHGAGSQRSDPKTGNPANYPNGFGPQGDAIRIYNFARLVRNVN